VPFEDLDQVEAAVDANLGRIAWAGAATLLEVMAIEELSECFAVGAIRISLQRRDLATEAQDFVVLSPLLPSSRIAPSAISHARITADMSAEARISLGHISKSSSRSLAAWMASITDRSASTRLRMSTWSYGVIQVSRMRTKR